MIRKKEPRLLFPGNAGTREAISFASLEKSVGEFWFGEGAEVVVEGGMGIVLRAMDVKLNRVVAVKGK